MMGMRLQLRPMQYMALACTGCGRFLSKPAEAAGDDEIHDELCGAVDANYAYKLEEGMQIKICRKCGRPFRKKRKV